MSFLSTFELFSIGIGPSSIHTVGPMRAARRFLAELKERELLEDVVRVQIDLYGSLSKEQASDIALQLGLEGEAPECVNPDEIPSRIARIRESGQLQLFGRLPIAFHSERDIRFLQGRRSPRLRFFAYDMRGKRLHSRLYDLRNEPPAASDPPFPFRTIEELLSLCQTEGLSMVELMFRNECTLRKSSEVQLGLLHLWNLMQESVRRGIEVEGTRQAPLLAAGLRGSEEKIATNPILVMEWVSLYAFAVSEESAAGGRIVAAPTNESAGVIPAVLHYCQKFIPFFQEEDVMTFLLTAAAIGSLYNNASSMAAAGLAALFGCTPAQIVHAAEIAKGPPLRTPEQNAMSAIKAINAALLARRTVGAAVC